MGNAHERLTTDLGPCPRHRNPAFLCQGRLRPLVDETRETWLADICDRCGARWWHDPPKENGFTEPRTVEQSPPVEERLEQKDPAALALELRREIDLHRVQVVATTRHLLDVLDGAAPAGSKGQGQTRAELRLMLRCLEGLERRYDAALNDLLTPATGGA